MKIPPNPFSCEEEKVRISACESTSLLRKANELRVAVLEDTIDSLTKKTYRICVVHSTENISLKLEMDLARPCLFSKLSLDHHTY